MQSVLSYRTWTVLKVQLVSVPLFSYYSGVNIHVKDLIFTFQLIMHRAKGTTS